MSDDEFPTDEQGYEDDPFDRRVSRLLAAEADLLRMYAEQLLETGAISIERSGGILTGQFSGPAWRCHGFLSWHRRPGLDLDATAATGSYSGCQGPMVTKYHDRPGLVQEISHSLAVFLAGLDEHA
ncbi:MAG: hypothetical protein ACTHKL_30025 [Streptosporangiaceae bacterium]